MYKLHPSTIALGLFLYAIYFVLVPDCGHVYDNQCWSDWAAYYLEKGFRHSYESGTNYFPGHLYQLKLFSLFFDSKEDLAAHIYQLKRITLLGDLVGAFLLASCTRVRWQQHALLLVLLLNPAFLHNTLVWGQFDTVFSALVFGSFIFLHKRRYLLSAISYLLALNFKFQAILFLPAMVLLFVYASGLKPDLRKMLRGLAILVAMQLVILAPFIVSKSMGRLWEVVDSLGGRYSYLSLYADNFWYLSMSGNLRLTGDFNTWMGLNYKTWGLIMTAATLLLVFFPLLLVLYKRWKGQMVTYDLEDAAGLLGLSVLAFFFFSTQMHERYTFPAFYFIAFLALQSRWWWLFGVFSMAYLLNNERALPHFLNGVPTILSSPPAVAVLYLIVLVSVLVRLWMPKKSAVRTGF